MRRNASVLALIVLVPLAARAQRLELVPRPVAGADSLPNGGWCFGMKLRPRDRCANFSLLEIGARYRITGKTDHSTADPIHAYPTLDDHGYLALGLAHRVAPRSALGVVGEYGAGGGERQAIGVRLAQQLGPIPRLDLTAGALRVETRQRGVTRRRWATGTFADAAIGVNEVVVIQARVERILGDGDVVKRATAAYVGARVEGGGAVKTTIVASAIMAALLIFVFFGGGGGD